MVDARTYHERTNHDVESLRAEGFRPDPETLPRHYKVYEDRPSMSLSSIRPPQAPALSVVAESGADPLAGTAQPAPSSLDRQTLASICYEATGIVRDVERQGETVRYRAASCTGKLYHVDAYVVCGDLADLDAGVYHVDPDSFCLDVLREGDYRGVLADATAEDGVAEAPATIVATSTWWRNAWKYRERTYRHSFWDTGTILANLLAATHALDHRSAVVGAFADDPVVELLGIDPETEAPIALASIGSGSTVPAAPTVDARSPDTRPYSEETREYPIVHDAWAQSTLDADAVADWRRSIPTTVGLRDAGDGDRVPLDPVDHEMASARPLSNVVRRRRSCRAYVSASLSRRKLGTILDRATRSVPADWTDADGNGLTFNDVYVLASGVDGVPDGTYQFHRAADALERLGPNDDATQTRLALGQEWAGDAHVNVYCMADVDAVVEALGNRGYRLAMLEAGLVLGRLYLATFAHRSLGGTGLTFEDDAVTAHFEPRADGQAPMTLFALGVAE